MSCNSLITEAYLLDELNGSTSGTVTGTAAYETLADGTQGFDFNGSTRIGYTLPGTFPTRATLFMRVKTSTFVATQSYGQLRDSLGIYRATGGVGVYSFANGAYQSPTATAVIAGQTLTVAAVYDGTACRSYYNGAAGAFSNVTGNLQAAGSANFRLGQSHTGGNGAIDTISRYMLFTRGLSAAEVAELHNWREPVNTVPPTLSANGDFTAGTWDSYGNGTILYSYYLQKNGVEIDVIAEEVEQSSGNALAAMQAGGPGLYAISVVAANNGGADGETLSGAVLYPPLGPNQSVHRPAAPLAKPFGRPIYRPLYS